MRKSAKLPLLARRQRRREARRSPLLGLWLGALTFILALLFITITVPAAAVGVGYLYLDERTPPAVDRLVENVAVAGVRLYAENFYEGELPSPEAVEEGTARDFKTTKIFDRTGEVLLWEVYDPRGGNRQVVALEDVSPHLINATIALEDKTFYTNPGINLRGIARALRDNLTAGDITGGGSSITQQLVKLVAIPPEERFIQDYSRKIKEVILAIELNSRYDKDTILEWYLNTINYGRLAYGAEAAAATYFGKNASELTIAEAALLAMLPNAPALYDPYIAPEVAIERQHIVLGRMLVEGYITQAEHDEALAEPVLEHLAQPFISADIKAPHFTLFVVQQIEEQYGHDALYRGGLTVYTTLDYALFEQQQQMAREHVAAMQGEGLDLSNAAMVTINPRTGEIVSMLGSLDYNNTEISGQVNMALAPRQPGSSVKPYTFLTAFLNGYTAGSMIWDVRTVFDDSPNPPYVPENYYRNYNGPVLLRDALQQSLNIPSVKLMAKVGVDTVIQQMHRMGINTLSREEVGLSLTLGGGEVALLDHTYAFSVMANGGMMVGQPVAAERQRPGFRELDPVSVLRIEDARGETLAEYRTPETRQIISPQHAYLMQNIMSDNPARIPTFGEQNALVLPDRPVAVKTGTTNDFRDGWTLGFTPQYVTGVWVGNADYRTMGKEAPSGSVAAPLWQRAMIALHEGLPVEQFPLPAGMVQATICAKSGMLPTEYCTETKNEIYIEGTQPTQPDTLFQLFRLCGESGRLATVNCPADQVRSQVFMMIPPEAKDWAQQAGIPLPPSVYDSNAGAVTGGPVSITSPAPYSYVSGAVTISGSAFSPPTTESVTVSETITITVPISDTGPITGTTPITTTQSVVTREETREVATFRRYLMQVGPGLNPQSWTTLTEQFTTRQNEPLATWNTRSVPDGLYTLLLIVERVDGTVERFASQVTVDNVAPTVRIVYPTPDSLVPLGGDSWLNIQAEASDNISMDRVEFYVDGTLVETSRSTFTARWTREQANVAADQERQVELWVVAIDSAGNRTESERFRMRVVGRDE